MIIKLPDFCERMCVQLCVLNMHLTRSGSSELAAFQSRLTNQRCHDNRVRQGVCQSRWRCQVFWSSAVPSCTMALSCTFNFRTSSSWSGQCWVINPVKQRAKTWRARHIFTSKSHARRFYMRCSVCQQRNDFSCEQIPAPWPPPRCACLSRSPAEGVTQSEPRAATMFHCKFKHGK